MACLLRERSSRSPVKNNIYIYIYTLIKHLKQGLPVKVSGSLLSLAIWKHDVFILPQIKQSVSQSESLLVHASSALVFHTASLSSFLSHYLVLSSFPPPFFVLEKGTCQNSHFVRVRVFIYESVCVASIPTRQAKKYLSFFLLFKPLYICVV